MKLRKNRDVDLNLSMSLGYFSALNVPWKRFVQVSEATHTLILERQRGELYREVQLFLDEDDPFTFSSPLQSAAVQISQFYLHSPHYSPPPDSCSAIAPFYSICFVLLFLLMLL